MPLPGWPIVALVAGADEVGTLDKPGARVLDSIQLDANTPTVGSVQHVGDPTPETDRRRSRRNRGTARCFVQRDNDGCIDETPGDPPAGGGSPASPISGTLPGAAVRSPRAELHVTVIGAVPFFRCTADSPGAAGRSAGPPFRDRNGHGPTIHRRRSDGIGPAARATARPSPPRSWKPRSTRSSAPGRSARNPAPAGSHHAAASRLRHRRTIPA